MHPKALFLILLVLALAASGCTGPLPDREMEQACKASGGHWNECSSRCNLDNAGNPDAVCPALCEALCECGGIAGFGCPQGYACKTPEGIADALGYCIRPVASFRDCANAGYPVMESFPRQCRTPDGRLFTEDVCINENGTGMGLGEAEELARKSECGNNLIIDCTCPENYRREGETCNPDCYYREPMCLAPSVPCEKTYSCSSGTGIWWIGLSLQKEGCNPACVVDVETRQAEINWRCTGLILP